MTGASSVRSTRLIGWLVGWDLRCMNLDAGGPIDDIAIIIFLDTAELDVMLVGIKLSVVLILE